jgi:hypothetical protein
MTNLSSEKFLEEVHNRIKGYFLRIDTYMMYCGQVSQIALDLGNINNRGVLIAGVLDEAFYPQQIGLFRG